LSFSRRLALVALVAVVVLAGTSSGCGYALAGRGSFLPADIRSVGIPQLENRTQFLQLEQILTEKVRNEFIGRGKYQVLTEPAGADAVLSGAITSVFLQPVGLTDQQLASRYLFTLTLSVRFTDARNSEVLWANDALTFRGEYDLGTQSSATLQGATFLDQERSSFDRISNDIARTVVTAILEAF
jgi:hypothetical protein